MNWRLTPTERRIIERTRREREGGQATTPAGDGNGDPLREGKHTQTTNPAGEERGSLWRSALAWAGGIAFLVLFAIFMLWLGSLIQTGS
jgi:hypothetical protein